MTNQISPSAPTASQTGKPPVRSRIIRWVQIFTGIALIIIVGLIMIANYITKDDLPGCDSNDAKSSLSDIFKSKNIQATRYNEIKTVSTSKEEILCTASLTLQDASLLEIDYRFYFEDKTKKIQITAARDKPKP
jgi:hypothetical protein